MIFNDYINYKNKKGLPDGHFPLIKVMTTPVFEGEKIVAIAGVGNKETNYNQNDLVQFETYFFNFWKLVSLARKTLDLKKSEERHKLFNNMSFEGLVIHENGIVIDFTDSFARVFDYPIDKLKGVNLFTDFLVQEDLPIIKEQVKKQHSEPFNVRAKKYDGSIIYLQIESQTYKYDGKEYRIASVRDVSQQKELEIEKKLLNDRLLEAEKLGKLGHWEMNYETGKLYWSDETYRIFGAEPQSFVMNYDWYKDHIHSDDLDFVTNDYQASIEQKRVYENEHRIIRDDNNEVRYVFTTGRNLFDKDGNIIKTFGIVQDITENKLLTIENEINRKRLEEAQKIAEMGYWEFDLNKDEIVLSSDAQRILKSPNTKINFKEFISLIHEDDRKRVENEFSESLVGITEFDTEHRVSSVDNKSLYIKQKCVHEYNEENDVVKSLGIILNITSQKEDELKLLESQKNFEILNNSSKKIVWTANQNGELTYCNEYGLKYFGKEKRDLIDWNWADLIHPDDISHEAEKWTNSIKKQEIFENIQRMLKYDGKYYYFKVVAEYNPDFEGGSYIGISTEIREYCLLLDDIESYKKLNNLLLIKTDKDLIIQDTSQAIQQLVKSELINKDLVSLIENKNDFQEYINSNKTSSTVILELNNYSKEFEINKLFINESYYFYLKELIDFDRLNQIVIDHFNYLPNPQIIFNEDLRVSFLNKKAEEYLKCENKINNDFLIDLFDPKIINDKILEKLNEIGVFYEFNRTLKDFNDVSHFEKVYLMKFESNEMINYLMIINSKDRINNSDTELHLIDLQERVKELNFIHLLIKKLSNSSLNMDDFFKQIVDEFPNAWQYPENTVIKIDYKGRSISSPNFIDTQWYLEREFKVNDAQKGLIKVVYTKEFPFIDEGPFLNEEIQLLDSTVELINIYLAKLLLVESFSNINQEVEDSINESTIELADIKIMSDVLNQKNEELERSNKALQDFAYVTSHDLQEPLRVMTSYMQLLEKNASDKLDVKSQRYIIQAVKSAKRMKDLIQGLLSFSRINTKGADFSPFDTKSTIENVISSLSLTIKENKVDLDLKLDNTIIDGDKNQFGTLVQNLIQNSIKFKKPDIDPIISIKSEVVKNKYLLKVKDNGIGIDEKYSEKVFMIFQRLHDVQTEGEGIGLALCKRIVERHNGNISFNSDGESYTEFIIELPLRNRNE